MIIKAFSEEYFKELKEIRKKDIIFFNGVFDLIHLGHLKMINHIKKNRYMGNSVIICAINSDESVRKLNKSHPLINDEIYRANFLLELGIDRVIIFDEDNPSALIMSLMPDVVFKGEDYKNENFPEKEFLDKTKIRYSFIKKVDGYSTTNIYNRISHYAKENLRRKLDEA